jgi:hypothetical protein
LVEAFDATAGAGKPVPAAPEAPVGPPLLLLLLLAMAATFGGWLMSLLLAWGLLLTLL